MTLSLRFKRDCGREMPLLAEFERILIKARTGGLDGHRERGIVLGAGCGRSDRGVVLLPPQRRDRVKQGAHGASACLSTAGAGKVNVTFEFCRCIGL
jgi:hypothetical protein